MYHYTKTVRKEFGHGFGSHKDEYTTLEAQFRFWDETPPNNRKSIRERLDIGTNSVIATYLHNKAQLKGKRDTCWRSQEFVSKELKVKLTKNPYRLAINLSATAKGNVPLDDLLDLEGLNHLIISGHIIQTSEESPNQPL